MTPLIFAFAMFGAIMLVGLTLVSVATKLFHFWPPPSKDSLQRHVFWILFRVQLIGTIALSWADYNKGPIPDRALRFFVGLPLLTLGFGSAFALTLTLGWSNAHGEAQGLVTTGCYRWSRNPVYATSLVGMLGWAIFANSIFVSILLSLWAIFYVVAPFLEEPWLEEQYGDAYRDYKRRIPRFAGIPKRRSLEA